MSAFTPPAQQRESHDAVSTLVQLAKLTVTRARFRLGRTLDRIRSPRRIIATSLAVLFFLFYLLNGIFILSARAPADPQRLVLWLSGGMVLYAIYHGVRCAWSSSTSDLELSAAENLWLGGAPVQRSLLAVYHVGNMVVPAVLKTLLLAVVLARDVHHLELLVIGVFASLVLLEIVRLVIARWFAGLAAISRRRVRIAATLVAAAAVLQVVARVLAMTPLGSASSLYILHGFQSLGQTAASDMIQWFSVPWIAAAHLAVTDQYRAVTLIQLLASGCMLPLGILTLVHVDQWTLARQHRRERDRLARGQYRDGAIASRQPQPAATGRSDWWLDRRLVALVPRIQRLIPNRAADAAAIVSRSWISVSRYRGTIAFSFLIPTLLCLSPLATGQETEQWLLVVGGIAMCTMLLAPPALRIDFRRDLRRMLLLRSLPIKPLSMVLGQLALPIGITWVYQWLTLAIAAAVTRPAWSHVWMWTGTLAALAVFTFALENALFLAYPHHERSEGIAMMIRAKLTFLGKATVVLIAFIALIAWSMLCRRCLPAALVVPSFVGGSLLATWCTAAAALAATTTCWQRFDLACDTPPE